MFVKENYEVFVNPCTAEKFETYKNALKEKNKQFNLTSILEDEDIYIKHFLDSIEGEKFINSGDSVVEIGSGGGFPSVPLKIVRNDLNFSLIETTGKKCTFLNEVKNFLGFENFEVYNNRCEDLAKKQEFREKFDVAVARAVAELRTLVEYALPFVKVNGIFIAYKGDKKEEIENAENAIKILGGKIKQIYEYELPEGAGKRSLVIIEKVFSTPEKYPRGKGKERSKPL